MTITEMCPTTTTDSLSLLRSKVLTFALGLWALAGCSVSDDPTHGAKAPNIYLFSMDALRADRLTPYGHDRDTTPYLGALAKKGIVFEHASATTSWTVPSVASMLTGMMPHQLAVTRVRIDASGTEEKVPSTAITIAERLKTQGYATYAVTSNALLSSARGYAQGFDHYVNVGFEDAAHVARALEPFERDIRSSSKPVFLWVHLFDPHDPYSAKSPWIDQWDADHATYAPTVQHEVDNKPLHDLTMASLRKRTDLRRGQRGLPLLLSLYDSEIRYADEILGEVHDRLDISDDDLVVFTADHGEEFRDHSALGHHLNLFEETVRVPLIVSWPSRLEPGRRIQRVSLKQITPTFAEIAGVPVGPYSGVSSRSLMPVLEGKPTAPNSTVLLDVTRIGGSRMMGVYSGPMKLVLHEQEPTKTQLFDLFTDPEEAKNLAADRPDTVARLSHVLNEELSSLPTLEPEFVEDETPDAVIEELKAMGYVH
jgi:choline-sulfatase